MILLNAFWLFVPMASAQFQFNLFPTLTPPRLIYREGPRWPAVRPVRFRGPSPRFLQVAEPNFNPIWNYDLADYAKRQMMPMTAVFDDEDERPAPRRSRPVARRPRQSAQQQVSHRSPASEPAEPKPQPKPQEAPAPQNTPPMCATNERGTDMWSSTMSVASENIIPPRSGYSMSQSGWPSLRRNGGRLEVAYGPSKVSMCTSATATAFNKHIADLVNSGQLSLTARQIEFINGPEFRGALNGNSGAVAYLFSFLGGQSIRASSSGIEQALAQAKPGDFLQFDRKSGSGHSTIFKSISGDKVCYWSSNGSLRGVSEQCEPLSKLSAVYVSRFPSVSSFASRLDEMMANLSPRERGYLRNDSRSIPTREIRFAAKLECNTGRSIASISSTPQVAPGIGTAK